MYSQCKKIDSIIVAVAIMGERRTGMSGVEGKRKNLGVLEVNVVRGLIRKL
jgi:hypothetical protein